MTKETQTRWNKDKDYDLMDSSIVVRFPKKELDKRVMFVLEKEVCQVCENSQALDYPHHARFGNAKKDDRYLVNICIDCHRIIHTKGFKTLSKTREETEDIGWNNHKEYMNETT